jgi:hypothetical protein
MVRCCESRLIKYRIELRMRNLFPIESNRSTFILYINPCVFRSLSITFIQEDSVMARWLTAVSPASRVPSESLEVHNQRCILSHTTNRVC